MLATVDWVGWQTDLSAHIQVNTSTWDVTKAQEEADFQYYYTTPGGIIWDIKDSKYIIIMERIYIA